MAADYDLVILGGTLEGRYAALSAVGYGARVALIEPPGTYFRRQQAKHLLRGLQQLGEGRQRQSVSKWFEQAEISSGSQPPSPKFDWLALVRWSAIAAKTQQPQLSPDVLSARGVDVILAMPKRLSRQLIVTVAGRKLSTRAVLAAFGSVALPLFGACNCLTGVEQLLEANSLPQSICVWGDAPIAVEWSQALNAMGISVSLVTNRFLPNEDSEVRSWVLAQLTATGIQLIDPVEASGRDAQLNRLHLPLGRIKPALMLPDFVYYPASDYPNVDEQIPERTYLLSNQHLQTAHPRVFACGSLIHGQSVGDATSQAEAQIAVWNALFVPNRRVEYSSIPHSYHRFARVGLTPRFAKEDYSPTGDYTVFTASSGNSTDLSRSMPLPSYCKLICKRGRLQSIHLLGDGADQLAVSLAAVIGQPIYQLLSFAERIPAPPVAEGLASLVLTAANQSQQTRWQPRHWRRDWAENWFNWRRSQKD
ncbi:MAG: FAD-dependent oxidoreductase [Phormidesmis sp.]